MCHEILMYLLSVNHQRGFFYEFQAISARNIAMKNSRAYVKFLKKPIMKILLNYDNLLKDVILFCLRFW